MQTDRTASLVAFVFAGAFFLATIIGFLPNPVVGDGALFHTNTAHNLVHLATALGFLTVAVMGDRASMRFMQWFGPVYLAVGVLGVFAVGADGFGYLLGVVHINALDNLLHVGLGTVILLAGMLLSRGLRPVAEAPVAVAGRRVPQAP